MMNIETDSTTGNSVCVKDARLVDLPGMVLCHRVSFPQSFMTEMGMRWLYGLYHFFLRHQFGISCVATDATGKVLGFVAGGKPGIRDEFLRIAIFRYVHIILWKFLTKSVVRQVLLAELFKKLKLKETGEPVSEDQKDKESENSCGLLSICVLPEFRGKRIASKLIDYFKQICISKGYDRITLSALEGNARAIAFYEREGWRSTKKTGKSIKFSLEL
ncbi:MAG: GNAT family N-acetyltransferase [Planctomycetota bacterium]|jgi:ribosomal protein S18 acetylase RimI-like enzyme